MCTCIWEGPIAYPLVMTNIAIESRPFIVDLPIKKKVIFHSFLYVYQRVPHVCTISEDQCPSLTCFLLPEFLWWLK